MERLPKYLIRHLGGFLRWPQKLRLSETHPNFRFFQESAFPEARFRLTRALETDDRIRPLIRRLVVDQIPPEVGGGI